METKKSKLEQVVGSYLRCFSDSVCMETQTMKDMESVYQCAENISKEFEGGDVDVELDRINMDLKFIINVPEIITEYGKRHMLFSLISKADSFNISSTNKYSIKLTLTFKNKFCRPE